MEFPVRGNNDADGLSTRFLQCAVSVLIDSGIMESDGHHSVTHPVSLTGPNPNRPFPSEGVCRNLSTLCAKTLLEISARHFGATPNQSPQLLPKRLRDIQTGANVMANKSTSLYRTKYITIVLSNQAALGPSMLLQRIDSKMVMVQ